MTNRPTRPSLVVIGGGAAGFFCAVNAARMQPELSVMVVEKTRKLLSKVKISGGGRCNVTHACFDIRKMAAYYPRGENFLKKSFRHFFTTDTIDWFTDRDVALKTEADNRVFPVTDQSQSIIDCLLNEASKHQVTIRLGHEVTAIERGSGYFRLRFRTGEELNTTYLCIACGGFPKAALFDWLRPLGHHICEPVPSLFTFNIPGHPLTELMGISLPDATLAIAPTKMKQRGALLITHWGLSGPVTLRLSAWAARMLAERCWHFTVRVNWLPEFNETSFREACLLHRTTDGSRFFFNKNPFGLPVRLWQFLAGCCEITSEMRWADIPARSMNRFVNHICNYELPVRGKTTFKEEFVTAGGIALESVCPNTLESRLIPNLFFAGEILDIDGITGGFNFQNAWTTGYVAARTIASRS